MVQKQTIELQCQVLCQEGEESGMQDRERTLSQSFRPNSVDGEQLDGCEPCTDQEIHAGGDRDTEAS